MSGSASSAILPKFNHAALVWAVVGATKPEDERAWIVDLLPDDVAASLIALMSPF
jgi:hypothetical protein